MQQQRSTRRRASATARHPRDPAVRSRRGVGAACEDFLLDPLGLGAPGRCQDYAPLATGRRSSTAPLLLRCSKLPTALLAAQGEAKRRHEECRERVRFCHAIDRMTG